MAEEKKTILDQLREFKEYKDYDHLPPAIKLLVEFAEKHGLFDKEKKETEKPVEVQKNVRQRVA